MNELPYREALEPLKIVTLHDKAYGNVSSAEFDLFHLYDTHVSGLSLIRLQPGCMYGNIKDMLRVWTVTLLKGSITVKVSRKKLLIEPYETTIIQPGPPRSIVNAAEHGTAEFLLAKFPKE